jgi:hypothetical protein
MSPRAAAKVTWRPNDSSVPLQQGDLLLVARARTIELRAESITIAYPTVGKRDALSLPFWDGNNPPILEMWACLNYGLVVVVADDCSIDKEFNIRRHCGLLQSRINWLAFEREYAKHALVYPAQRFAADEALQPLDTEGELPRGQ